MCFNSYFIEENLKRLDESTHLRYFSSSSQNAEVFIRDIMPVLFLVKINHFIQSLKTNTRKRLAVSYIIGRTVKNCIAYALQLVCRNTKYKQDSLCGGDSLEETLN